MCGSIPPTHPSPRIGIVGEEFNPLVSISIFFSKGKEQLLSGGTMWVRTVKVAGDENPLPFMKQSCSTEGLIQKLSPEPKILHSSPHPMLNIMPSLTLAMQQMKIYIGDNQISSLSICS